MRPSQGNMANFNWEQGNNIKILSGAEGNKNNFRDQKVGNKFESNLRNKGTQANI